MSRQKFSKELKAQMALEAIRGIKTVNEIAAEFGVYPTHVANWKREALEALSLGFDSKAPPEAEQKAKEDPLPPGSGNCRWRWTGLKKGPDISTDARRDAGGYRTGASTSSGCGGQKYEEVLREYEDMADLHRHLRQYFEYYNNERPHQSLDYQTPLQVYRGHNKVW